MDNPLLHWRIKWHKEPIPQNQAGAEIEQLTTQLIEDTIGSNGVLQKKFDSLLAQYRRNPYALGTADAQNFLFGLLKEAVAQRRLLSGRIEKSVESGILFQRYYSRMQYINHSTNVAYEKMEQMQAAEKRYKDLLGIYRQVIGNAYDRELISMQDDDSKHETPRDLWIIMDNVAGQAEQEQVKMEVDEQ